MLKNVELLDFILQSDYNKDKIDALTVLIENINESYFNIFKLHLKPKHHFIMHYPEIIKKMDLLKPSTAYDMKRSTKF